MTTNVFMTGATGFVGTALIKRLLHENVRLTAAVLAGEDAGHVPATVRQVTFEPLSESGNYESVVQNMDVVIHLAARVHIMKDIAMDPLLEFRKVNLHGTERLARQAAGAGVKRFVFMSTIGVHGDNSGEVSYAESDSPNPHNPYSISKYEAELILKDIAMETGMEIVILRAPLVYGPGNPGNLLSLLRIVSMGIPLPFATILNKRSLIYVFNLADALAVCASHPAAHGQTYLVSDSEAVSTPELIRRIAAALAVPARLFPFSSTLMNLAGSLIGKRTMVNSLLGSLTVNSSKIRNELGWNPPFTMAEGLQETAQWFHKKK